MSREILKTLPYHERYLRSVTVILLALWCVGCASQPAARTFPPDTRRVVVVARDSVLRGAVGALESAQEFGRELILSRRAVVDTYLRRVEQVMEDLRRAVPQVDAEQEYDTHDLRRSVLAARQAVTELVTGLPGMAASRPEVLDMTGQFLAAVDAMIVLVEGDALEHDVTDFFGAYAHVVDMYNDWRSSVEGLVHAVNANPIGLLQ